MFKNLTPPPPLIAQDHIKSNIYGLIMQSLNKFISPLFISLLISGMFSISCSTYLDGSGDGKVTTSTDYDYDDYDDYDDDDTDLYKGPSANDGNTNTVLSDNVSNHSNSQSSSNDNSVDSNNTHTTNTSKDYIPDVKLLDINALGYVSLLGYNHNPNGNVGFDVSLNLGIDFCAYKHKRKDSIEHDATEKDKPIPAAFLDDAKDIFHISIQSHNLITFMKDRFAIGPILGICFSFGKLLKKPEGELNNDELKKLTNLKTISMSYGLVSRFRINKTLSIKLAYYYNQGIYTNVPGIKHSSHNGSICLSFNIATFSNNMYIAGQLGASFRYKSMNLINMPDEYVERCVRQMRTDYATGNPGRLEVVQDVVYKLYNKQKKNNSNASD